MIVRKAVLLLAILATGCHAGPTLTSGTAPPVRTVLSIALPGAPAGGVFFTNLEDKDRTLRIDVRSRRVTTTWLPGCGDDGPKGLALDQALDFLFVACRDRVMVLDAGRDGRRLSTIDVGDGIDNIDYVERRHEL